jgi:hypothetical protein
VRNEMET